MSIEQRVRDLETDMQALKTSDALRGQQYDQLVGKLDSVEETFKTGWLEANQTFKDQVNQLRQDRQTELKTAADERAAEREERRWWWTKAFGITTTVLGTLGALGGGAYYSMAQPTIVPSAIPAPIHVAPPESVP